MGIFRATRDELTKVKAELDHQISIATIRAQMLVELGAKLDQLAERNTALEVENNQLKGVSLDNTRLIMTGIDRLERALLKSEAIATARANPLTPLGSVAGRNVDFHD